VKVKELPTLLKEHFGEGVVFDDAFVNPLWNHPDPDVQYIYKNGALITPWSLGATQVLFLAPMESYFYQQVLYGVIHHYDKRTPSSNWLKAVTGSKKGDIVYSMPIRIDASYKMIEGFVNSFNIIWYRADRKTGRLLETSIRSPISNDRENVLQSDRRYT
jgi:hypothetical protein